MALLSAVAIANMALMHLGRAAHQIESFTERSVEARSCAVWYDTARRQVLEAHDWPFARRRQSLALHADDPPDQWGYRFQVPSDCVAVRRIWNPLGEEHDAIPYELEMDDAGLMLTLLTDVDEAILIYTRDADLVQNFTPLFVNTLSHYLAWQLAGPLTGKAALAKQEADAFYAGLRSATASAANQGVARAPRDAESIRARQ